MADITNVNVAISSAQKLKEKLELSSLLTSMDSLDSDITQLGEVLRSVDCKEEVLSLMSLEPRCQPAQMQTVVDMLCLLKKHIKFYDILEGGYLQPEAFNWFHLSIPTDLLNCQPLQSLPAAEINYSSLLPNEFQNPVGLENLAGLASPPCTPKGFPSASAILQSPRINPQLRDLGQLRLNEDVHEHEEQTVLLDNSDGRRQVCEEDSDGRNGESRGKDGEDKGAAMGVKEVQEDKMEEDYEEKGQEEKQGDE